MPVSTDAQKIDQLLTRGVEHVYPTQEFLEKHLLSGEQLTLYTGYDPTAPTLHIGHGITMMKLRQFQDLGHKIIFLIGDFTGMIGDPTDKTSARQKLTSAQIKENFSLYKEQAAQILDFEGDNPVEVRYNSEWHGALSFTDVIELSSNFTVQRMLERDMFQNRIKDEKPIYLHEFMYPLMQGYDSVAMGVDGEVGGNDQTFNMLAGRTLLKQLKEREKFVVCTKLLVDSSGKKMSKTSGNMVAFSDTPEDMFGKIMRFTDEMIISGFELCTYVSMGEIEKIQAAITAGENPRDFKLRLAFEITKTFLGEDAANIGKDHFSQVIQSSGRPESILTLTPKEYTIVPVLVEAGFATSTSDARRTIEGGGVKVNDEKVNDITLVVSAGDVIQKGKRFFVEIQ
ncbi:MAG: tyrosine--tRNA ligase [Candidatus Magasanikbacteria bacterium]|jgi:tyrosyl-tRNA synthetase|nr:tyrosine--tRNA ligase [Candidatus Magasanikbacteria bacterium]MBT4220710.1 tyrosine--tRNA ligase [Candidatus Magasanikbacteria bacterium]MBT4350055.1 tyrosine--tRNA ligase [Candidatus Magasanikbacteria bacterium]MBT4541502.1 tyrosine--tRNA ligase [Candidatus Magasanikbacteria bacterium]MBT6253030.1 tyrosine--tRNA ligase [Candidatus Magasanikbacteria bacterium]